MALVRISDNGGFKPIVLLGVPLERGQEYPITVLASLMRCSDKNLHFTFEESDREEMMSLDTELFPVFSAELAQTISTHDDLAKLLLPKKSISKKKVAPKPKKSSLDKE